MGRIVGAYFSPTGGTRRALEEICGLLDAPWDRLELAGPEKGSCALGREDLLVLALPVYAGQRPAVPGLLEGLAGEETPCLLMATGTTTTLWPRCGGSLGSGDSAVWAPPRW